METNVQDGAFLPKVVAREGWETGDGQREPGLTIVFIWNEQPDLASPAYRALRSVWLIRSRNLRIVETVGQPTAAGMHSLLQNVVSDYVMFVHENHDITPEFITGMLSFLEGRIVYLAEPWLFYATTPGVLPTVVTSRYQWQRPLLPFGIAFRRVALLICLEANDGIDFSAVYLTYRIYWRLNKVTPRPFAYAYKTQIEITNGIRLDVRSNLLTMLGQPASGEVRRMLLRYLILVIRYGRATHYLPVRSEHIGALARDYRLESLKNEADLRDKVELAIIDWCVSSSSYLTLYKELAEKDVYLEVGPSRVTEGGVCVSRVDFAGVVVEVRKIRLERSLRNELSDPAHIDYYEEPVSVASTILMFDRSTAADDNAEYFYRYMRSKHPEFERIYFALAKSSKDWGRLADDGFQLVEMFSTEFYDIFLESDVVVSSQMYNISRFGKNFSNSRFVYLQHGIQLNDMTDWVVSKFFDVFVVTGEPEAAYMREIAPEAVLNSGIPRLESLKGGKGRNLVFMPTWRFSLNSVSDRAFKESDYFKNIQELVSDTDIGAFVEGVEAKFVLKLHPNLVKRAHLLDLPSWAEVSTESYRSIIEHAEVVITDYSSVVADAAFAGVPIVYYQWDEDTFFEGQPYGQRLDYRTQGMGPVFVQREDVVRYLVSKGYVDDTVKYARRRSWFFEGVERYRINDRIFERMMSL